MSRIAYVNGAYVPLADAAIHIEDRGYQFADGVYEVIAVLNGKLLDAEGHWKRLERSLAELAIESPMSMRALAFIVRRVIRMNRLKTGIVYIQVTRGSAPRDHAFPKEAEPALVVTAKPKPGLLEKAFADKGVFVISVPDLRWKRCDIKTVSLLPNILAKQAAQQAGAFEAWQVDDAGFVTEGTASNAWIVTDAGEVLTRQADQAILSGITRATVQKLADRRGLKLVERAFSLDEAKAAREAFLTSTTSFVKPVVKIDGDQVADGKPGSFTCALRDAFKAYVESGEGLS